MSNNIKSRGFTIVELLIVIVVIAILATISIVAYNGIQNRGKISAAKSLTGQIAKKAEAWNTVQTGYPTYCNFALNHTNATGSGSGVGTAGCTANGTPALGPQEAKIDNPNSIRTTTAVDQNAVQYTQCNSGTGARISWVAGGESDNTTLGTGC
jgi:prepilin-type N-terminal cleavage/methylation domain-containing protein